MNLKAINGTTLFYVTSRTGKAVVPAIVPGLALHSVGQAPVLKESVIFDYYLQKRKLQKSSWFIFPVIGLIVLFRNRSLTVRSHPAISVRFNSGH